jgi:opacity protein-like surface antigen
MVVSMSLHRNINELALGSPVAMSDGVKEENKNEKNIIGCRRNLSGFFNGGFCTGGATVAGQYSGDGPDYERHNVGFDLHLKSRDEVWRVPARYSYQFNNWAGVEGNYGYTRNTQNYLGSFGQSAVEANTHEVTGSFVFHIPVKAAHVRPYALAGGGALIFDPTDKFLVGGVDRQTKGAFVYGGGFNFDVARNFGIRTEYRGLVYKTPDFKLNTLTLDKVTHLAQPSVGFYFRF